MRIHKHPWPIKVALWPSVQEIEESTSTNLYMGGLDEFHDSVQELFKAAKTLERAAAKSGQRDFSEFEDPSGHFSGEPKYFNATPESIIHLLITVGSSGLAVGVYSLLRAWIEKISNRRLRLKFLDFEIEATQLSEEQFQRFIDFAIRVIDNPDLLDQRRALKKELESSGFTLIDQDFRNEMAEQRPILQAVAESYRKIQKQEPSTKSEEESDV